MSNRIFTQLPSVKPFGNGVVLGASAFGTTGGYACADAAFGRVRVMATATEQHPGTQVWSPPT